MGSTAPRKETPVSMRFRDDDLTIIDRGAELLGLSRTEFMRRAALSEAQTAILNESVIRLSPDAYDAFMQAISAPAEAPSPKVAERLRRSAPWER
ncbi:type II toxin-antitoxin system TacA family antitoxin [Brucella endophytica]